MKSRLKYCLIILAAVIALLVALACWPYMVVASPNSTLRIVDDSEKPIVGIHVNRQWDTSEGQKGEDEGLTDNNGQVNFKRVEFRMSLLKRITKPLLIFVPASCGPSWEVYGETEFEIYWPPGYVLKFDESEWKEVNGVYASRNGIEVFDPAQSTNKSFVKIRTLNKQDDYSYTLTLYKQDRVAENLK